jgi:hypothetical protein
VFGLPSLLADAFHAIMTPRFRCFSYHDIGENGQKDCNPALDSSIQWRALLYPFEQREV